MARPYDDDVVVAEQRLDAQLRPGGAVDDPGAEVDAAVAQQVGVLRLELRHEDEAQPGGELADAGDERRAEILDEAAPVAEREGPHHFAHVDRLDRRQHGLGLLHEQADAAAQLQRPRRGHEAAPGAHQQRVAGRGPQPRQRPAGRRRAEAQPARGARHAAFHEQRFESQKQVQVGLRHGFSVAQRRDVGIAPRARI